MQNNRQPATGLLSVAINVFAACLLLYLGVHLLLAVWPVLVGVGLLAAVGTVAFRFLRYRDHW